MDALKVYVDSDENDDFLLVSTKENEFEVSCKENSQIDECDYFGLKFNDSENESTVKIELDNIRLSSRLEEQSALLHESNYGPNYLNSFEAQGGIKDNKNTPVVSSDILSKRKCLKRICEYQETSQHASKRYQTKWQDCYRFETESDESPDLPQFNEIQKKCIIFEQHAKITQHISNGIYSLLPTHAISKLDIHSSCISKTCWSSPQYSHLLLSSSLDGNLKIYNMFTKNCERQLKDHRKGVRAALWTLCGTKIFSGGYDGKALLTDAVTGNVVNTYSHNGFVSSVQRHPEHESLLLTGTKNHIMIWDSRLSDQHIRKFSSHCGQVLDIAFLSAGKEVIFSSDIVSKDSADRTIIAWDFETGALLSNQIYQERYTCPCLRVEPGGANFIAQTNGSYIAIFSSSRPYKMNKNKRYEGHKVAGFNIDCDFSPDGSYVVSGDAEGGVYIYETKSAKLIRKLPTLTNAPTSSVAWHPVLPSTIAVGTVTGHLQIWE